MGAATNQFETAVRNAEAALDAFHKNCDFRNLQVQTAHAHYLQKVKVFQAAKSDAPNYQQIYDGIKTSAGAFFDLKAKLAAEQKADNKGLAPFKTATAAFENHLRNRKKSITSKLRPKAFTSIPKAEALVKQANDVIQVWEYELKATQF
jgi:hypothetical protein